MAKHPSRAA